MRLRTERGHAGRQRQGPPLATGHRPGEEEQEPERQHGDVRVPHVVQEVGAEGAHDETAPDEREDHQGRPLPALRDQRHARDRGAVDRQRPQRQPDRGARDEPVRHCEQVEQRGARVRPVVAGEEPDQHRVVPDVASVHLDHGLVSVRGVRAPDTDQQRDGRDQEGRQCQREDESVAVANAEPGAPRLGWGRRRRRRATECGHDDGHTVTGEGARAPPRSYCARASLRDGCSILSSLAG